MQINTEYKIGQEVWQVEKTENEYVVNSNRLYINCIKCFYNSIIYGIWDEIRKSEIFIDEEKIDDTKAFYFTTRKDARIECDRRNHEMRGKEQRVFDFNPKTLIYYDLSEILKAMESAGHLSEREVWREYISEYGASNDTIFWLGFAYYSYTDKEDKYNQYFSEVNKMLGLPIDNDGIRVSVSW